MPMQLAAKFIEIEQWAVVMLVSFPLGWILWLALRPPLRPPGRSFPAGHAFDLDRYRVQ
jgi:hypothetical protein